MEVVVFWVEMLFLEIKFKTELKREHLLKGTLRKQSNKNQNSPKKLLKADKEKLTTFSTVMSSVSFDVCSIAFVMHLLNSVPFSIWFQYMIIAPHLAWMYLLILQLSCLFRLNNI